MEKSWQLFFCPLLPDWLFSVDYPFNSSITNMLRQ